MLTKELTEQINAALTADLTAAEQIMTLPADQAAEALQKKGLDVTADDVTAYIQAAQSSVSGELDEQALENVAGGASIWQVIYNYLHRGGGSLHTSSSGFSHGGGGGRF